MSRSTADVDASANIVKREGGRSFFGDEAPGQLRRTARTLHQRQQSGHCVGDRDRIYRAAISAKGIGPVSLIAHDAEIRDAHWAFVRR